jgi:hypothetical protein
MMMHAAAHLGENENIVYAFCLKYEDKYKAFKLSVVSFQRPAMRITLSELWPFWIGTEVQTTLRYGE